MSRQSFSRIYPDARPSFSKTYKDSIDTNISRNLKQQISIINSSRQSLTRLSLNSFTQDIERLHTRRPSMRQKEGGRQKVSMEGESRGSFGSGSNQKETIARNLVGKLEHQEELRSIIQSKYKSRPQDKQNRPLKPESQDYLLNKLKQSERDIDRLKSLLLQSQTKVRLLQQEKNQKPQSSRLRTADKCTQTQDQKQEIFLRNLDSVIQELENPSAREKYRLY